FSRDTVEASIRVRNGSGFIFLSNYERNVDLPAVKGFQLRLRTAKGEERIPERPVTFGANRYTIWPYNLDVQGMNLHYATAQPLCSLDKKDCVFFADTVSEFCFDARHLRAYRPLRHCTASASRGRVRFTTQRGATFRIVSDRGDTVTVLVLSREDA